MVVESETLVNMFASSHKAGVTVIMRRNWQTDTAKQLPMQS